MGLRIALFHNLHSGGAKRTLYEEARRLAERHHLDLYTLSGADSDFCDVQPYMNEVHTYDFEPGPLFRSPLGRLNQGMRLLGLVRLRRLARHIAADMDAAGYDVAFVHPSQFTQSPLVLQFLHTPTVYYCHEPLRRLYEPRVTRPYQKRSLWLRMLDTVDPLLRAYRLALRRADWASLRSATRVLVNSRFTRENVRRIYGMDAVTCPLGIDTDVFRPLGLSRDGTVLSVGALTPNKGFDFIIKGLACVPEEQRPSLVIISNYVEPRERAYLEELATARGVAVTVRIGVNDRGLVEAYNRATLVAYAPVREPLGLVPLEAMACETPVVGVREGGVAETMQHQETGLLVERRPDALAQALQSLLDDQSLARRFGEQGRRHVCEMWEWSRAVDVLEQHLQAVAEGGP